MKRSLLPACAVVAAALAQLAGCGPQPSDEAASPAATANTVGETTEYAWYAEGTPAGSHTVVRTGDGRVSTELFVHWNNREYTLDDELQLDGDGLVQSQRITGTSPFGAPVDETFTLSDGFASWRSVGESGSVTDAGGAFYLPNEFGAIESLAALVRTALGRLDGELELIPSGTARVSKLVELELSGDAGPQTVGLYPISGIRFTPTYIWLDSDLNVFALDIGGFMGMTPKGFGERALTELSRAQSGQEAAYFQSVSPRLARKLDRPLVFAGVDVVDVETGKLLESRHVAVEDGKISAIATSPVQLDNGLVIDARGKTLIPGLWDMHGHFQLSDGILNIAAGVTSVRDVGSVHEKILHMTSQFDSGAAIGPRTYRAGFIDQASPYATGDTVSSLEEALERVDFYADHGYIQVKLYSSIDPSWVKPIAERTHARGMRLSGHIPAFMSAEQAVRAGYDEIQHINMVFLNFLAADREDTRKQLRFTLYGDKAGDVDLDSAEAQAFFDLLAEQDVVIDPTAAIFDTQLLHKAGEPDPTYGAVIDHLPVSVARGLYNPSMLITAENEAAWAKSQVNALMMLRKLHERGIRIVPGSDSIAGFTLHRELELYAEAGIPNADVLRLATLESANIAGVADRSGSVSVGKDADLVLLDGNPLEDMSAIRRGVTVVKGEWLYRPEELYPAVGVRKFVDSLPAKPPEGVAYVVRE